MVVRGRAYLWKATASDGAVRSFSEAYDFVRAELSDAACQSQDAGVFAAHLEMLEDPMLREAVESGLSEGKRPLDALDDACKGICDMFSAIEDEYLKARVDDVRDVFGRLREAMCGGSVHRVIPAGSIIVAEEMFPSDLAKIDISRVGGIICRRGSSTSHVCMIARSHGVPIQLGVDVSGIQDGMMVEVDDPLVGESAIIASKVRAAGRRLYVNAGSIEDIRAGIASGADGVGVFRTEFLFLGRDTMPSREEQGALYAEALEACGGKTLVLRTLDVGGDKRLPYLPMLEEDNPFLGLRGVRFTLAHPDFFRLQLGGVLDAVRVVRDRHPEWFPGSSPLRLMLPMVCKADEIRAVKDLLVELDPDYGSLLTLGIMIETPAAVLDAPALAAECNFFSIGTNDLTQYVMAADRGNPAVASLYDAMSPAMLKAMEMTVDAAHSAVRPDTPEGIPVGICGELASDPRATDWLLAAGLDSLSLSKI